MFESVSNPMLLLFRRSGVERDLIADQREKELKAESPGIRCPLCEWRPSRSSRWMCWDCDYPEYFYNGCGSMWNTFDTEGRCPTCGHQWQWTSCLRCAGWSRHEEWYESVENRSI